MGGGFLASKRDLPVLGVGLGLRSEIARETFGRSESIDWLEFTPENYLGFGGITRSRLEEAGTAFPLVSHGVSLSIGGTDPLDMNYLKALKALLDQFDVPWWSDHLCFTSANGRSTHDLLPLPWSKEAVDHIVKRVRTVQEYIGRPFLLENISFYMTMPGAEMTEAQFLGEILEKADCGLLFDVNNAYVNSINHGFDPVEYMNQLPLERIVQIHIAGHLVHSRKIIDTHGEAIVEPVYELLSQVLGRIRVNAILLERDQNFPPFEQLLTELATIRRIADEALKRQQTGEPGSPEAITVISKSSSKRKRAASKTAGGTRRAIPLKELESAICHLFLDRKEQARLLSATSGSASAKEIRPSWLRTLIDRQGAATYAWLLNSNQESLVGNLYPVCRKVLGKGWHHVVNDYFLHFPPGNLNFRNFAENLPEFFAFAGNKWTERYPFLPALAEFEWEKVLVTDSSTETTVTETIQFTSREQLGRFRPLVNPVLSLRQFAYPVQEIAQQISSTCCPKLQFTAAETCLAIFRHPWCNETTVCKLSPTGMRLIATAQEGTRSYLELIESEGTKFEAPACENPFLIILELVDSFRQLGMLVGSEPVVVEDRAAVAEA